MSSETPESPGEPNGSVDEVQPPTDTVPAPAPQRLQSLDAYRGLIMITLAFTGFGLARTAALHLKEEGPSAFWHSVHHQFEHVEWVGCGYWDLIQPSFMFMVGVSMAYSYVKRAREGQSYGRMFSHAAWRSVVLIFLGIFLISNWGQHTSWSFMNVLTQIGLGYAFLFLLWGRSFRMQALTAAGILVVTWLLYVSYPYAGIDLATGAPKLGVTKEWAEQNLVGVPAVWHKNANIGWKIDTYLLNWLPQQKPWEYNRGGYATLNFLPSLATMIFGLMCGELLRTQLSNGRKLGILIAAGLAGIAVGWLLDATSICPLIKRIWTPSWALFSTGWCCLILAGLYAVVDMLGYRAWSFPLIVVGMNSIAIYCMAQLLKPWMRKTLQIHLGKDIFLAWGPLWEPTLQATYVGFCFWLACYWMYRQKIFVRI